MFDKPSYLIQFGYNGQTIVDRALTNDHMDGVILSPTDYPMGKNKTLAQKVNNQGKTVLFDPQYYIPRTERDAAQSYPYFESKGGNEFETVVVQREGQREELCREILSVQDKMGVDAYISPARHVDALVDRKINEWKDLTESFIEIAREDGQDIPIFAALPVEGDVISHPDERNEFLDYVTSIDPDGFYVSVQYEMGQRYPLTGAQDVHAYVDLMKSLKMNQFEVIAGHSHQIAHLLFAAGVDAFASGHYKNTKAFDVGRWEPDDEGFGRTVIYYYSDEILNDIRVEQGLQNLDASGFDISRLRTKSPYDGDLFAATTPESSEWKLSEESWDHYISACFQISRKYRNKDLQERIDFAKNHLEQAANLHEDMLNYVNEDELDSVDADVFDQWPSVLESIEADLENPLKRKMLEMG
ncbi:hypothetical protein [Halobacterium jilantaiense]|uniref:Uncharacterized protein n=1 Tax=Halobacterium jilantaiense TaxID=355548 RepID=A0A1I0P840_9EURY|nr:hypothetical protein [Halobacterium jilantaiense]SEW10378.1 hypothetical protein SAMN04487945_1469 [Halobacterium jilantaiense]